MDTTTRVDSPRRASAGSPRPPVRAADQPTLPFTPLPYDDESDRPIGYVLTARARRRVDPGAVPDLEVVAGGSSPAGAHVDDPNDTRPARARALRRAGLDITEISAQLDVDELLVDAWTSGVRRARSRAGRGSASRRSSSTTPARSRATTTGAESGRTSPEVPDARLTGRRDAASRQARGALTGDPSFALGLGLLVGIADVDRHAVTIRTTRQDVAARTLAWLRGHVEVDERRVRVVLRVGSLAAADLTRHRWASALGVAPGAVGVSRWRDAPDEAAVEVLVRVADPLVSATIDGFRRALDDTEHVEPFDGPHHRPDDPGVDVAF